MKTSNARVDKYNTLRLGRRTIIGNTADWRSPEHE